jgi:hypothetical protein
MPNRALALLEYARAAIELIAPLLRREVWAQSWGNGPPPHTVKRPEIGGGPFPQLCGWDGGCDGKEAAASKFPQSGIFKFLYRRKNYQIFELSQFLKTAGFAGIFNPSLKRAMSFRTLRFKFDLSYPHTIHSP